jgi:hypothetical protein
MPRLSSLAAAVVAVLATGGCDLDVGNPNDLDRDRAFADPASLEQLMSGALRNWGATRGDYFMMPLTTMADNYTASWNNAAIRFYSSVGSDCPSRCGWTNSSTAPEAAGGPIPEAAWYGYHTVLSSATGVLRGIANGVCFDADCDADNTLTSRNTAIAKMLQGMALSGIALLYDQGFAVDETTDLSNPLAIPFNTRAEVRDFALQKFEEAWTEAGLKTWSTPANWMGVGSGTAYTNNQIRQVIRTMQAELVALWPRNSAENTAANWAQVATYASQGISAAPAFDWQYFIDVNSGANSATFTLDWVKAWGNSILTMRVDTRLAAILTTNHVDPWPDPAGNPCPTASPDLRVGDGTFGPADNASWSTSAATANAGTDFACSEAAIFQAARGQYHQSNLQHIRYNNLAYNGENLPGFDGSGQDPFYTRQMNDLLWAEGLIRRPSPDLATAATLINNSRVGRGGLSTLTAADGAAALLAALQYEQEIEFMGQGPTPFFNRRRSGYNAPAGGGRPAYVDGLIVGTPRHMPVPAKELEVLVREIYTFGGPSDPELAPIANGEGGTRSGVRSVGEIWREYRAMAQANRKF